MAKIERWQSRWGFALLVPIAVLAGAALQGGQAIGATAQASAAKTVRIDNLAFQPPTLKVNRGSRVTFANSDNIAHTASSRSFDTKRLAPGKSVAVRFNRKGTFAYHCKIHPFMKGRIVVQ